MKRLSIAPGSVRRTSKILLEDQKAREILEQLDQDTTIVLQDIDRKLSRANAILNDLIKPTISEYMKESSKIKQSTGFWKKFFELSANVVLDTYEAPIVEVNANTDLINALEQKEAHDELKAIGETQELRNAHLKRVLDEETPTWSTEQDSSRKPTSSTPQKHTLTLTSLQQHHHQNQNQNQQNHQQRTRFNLDNDVPKLSDNVNLQHPSRLGSSWQSPRRKEDHAKGSPVRILTIHQSLDAYQRVSISPRKLRTPISGRSAVLQTILNSSPTFPEPPVLKSDLPSEPSRLTITSPHPSSDAGGGGGEPHLRKFPNTPKYTGTRSGSLHNTPILDAVTRDDEGENDLQPPQLGSSSQLHESGRGSGPSSGLSSGNNLLSSSSSDEPLPALNTIELSGSSNSNSISSSRARRSKRRSSEGVNRDSLKRRRTLDDDEDNVFLDREHSRSLLSPRVMRDEQQGADHHDNDHVNDLNDSADKDNNNNNNSSSSNTQNKSFSQVYTEEISKVRDVQGAGTSNTETNIVPVEDVTSENTLKSLKDITEGSTDELGPFKERWKYYASL